MKPESRRSAEMSAATETRSAPSFGSRVGSKRPAGIVMQTSPNTSPAASNSGAPSPMAPLDRCPWE